MFYVKVLRMELAPNRNLINIVWPQTIWLIMLLECGLRTQ